MRMIEGRQRSNAHETLGADLDDRSAQIMGTAVSAMTPYLLAS